MQAQRGLKMGPNGCVSVHLTDTVSDVMANHVRSHARAFFCKKAAASLRAGDIAVRT